MDRRDFIKVGVAGAVIPSVSVSNSASSDLVEKQFPILDIAPLNDIEPRTLLYFAYPDKSSPAVLIRLDDSAINGIGPNNEIVAYSQLCTHKGCPVSYRPERKMLICPCHWSTFDPSRAGTMIIGQASQALPQIMLRISDGIVQAYNIDGLIYGRQTNII
ncbi:MAG: arsenate reductase (azurin) small subunit [Acidiferrobacteraceae bacterium]|nr:arsenate reductase (azurin) small subunit [Acidiferrobacteraceae bacterium]|tara:strand:+ start:98 stop:577 length:480 start_codon:yes stop_codon:yes gene_type:complete